jgi:hypothetical protein
MWLRIGDRPSDVAADEVIAEAARVIARSVAAAA